MGAPLLFGGSLRVSELVAVELVVGPASLEDLVLILEAKVGVGVFWVNVLRWAKRAMVGTVRCIHYVLCNVHLKCKQFALSDGCVRTLLPY